MKTFHEKLIGCATAIIAFLLVGCDDSKLITLGEGTSVLSGRGANMTFRLPEDSAPNDRVFYDIKVLHGSAITIHVSENKESLVGTPEKWWVFKDDYEFQENSWFLAGKFRRVQIIVKDEQDTTIQYKIRLYRDPDSHK